MIRQMKPRLKLLLLLLVFASKSSIAAEKKEQTSNCQKYIRGYNEYDELVDGKLKEKFSVFEVEEWSPHTAFEGLLATKEVPAGSSLVLEFRKVIKGKIDKSVQGPIAKPWKNDPQYQKIEIDLKKVLSKETPSGVSTLKLVKKNGSVLCEQNLATTPGD